VSSSDSDPECICPPPLVDNDGNCICPNGMGWLLGRCVSFTEDEQASMQIKMSNNDWICESGLKMTEFGCLAESSAETN